MPSVPGIFAADVDGTLLRAPRTVTPAVRGRLASLVELGWEFVIATGRDLLGAEAAFRQTGLQRGWLICANGAVTAYVDGPNVDVTSVVAFSAALGIDPLLHRIPDARFAVERVGVGFAVNQPFPDGELQGDIEVLPIEELRKMSTPRLVTRALDLSLAEFSQVVQDAGLSGIEYSVGIHPWLDVTSPGRSKASALEEVRHQLGVPIESTVAVGDGSNDLDMIRWAGLGAVTRDASPVLHAAADLVVGSYEEDGVAQLVDRILAPESFGDISGL